MKLIDGLSFYELTLLILGVIFFIVLLIILLIFVKQRRSIKVLVPFFSFPIVMIGFPGYQKVTFDSGVLTIEKAQQELAVNPKDTTARKELIRELDNLKDKNISDPQTHLSISKGYAVIGDTMSALTSVNKALQKDPEFVPAKKLLIDFNNSKFKTRRIVR